MENILSACAKNLLCWSATAVARAELMPLYPRDRVLIAQVTARGGVPAAAVKGGANSGGDPAGIREATKGCERNGLKPFAIVGRYGTFGAKNGRVFSRYLPPSSTGS
ncbi:hypothetical protein FN846DRAFT_1002250 [Sphaerosporella brunnea]|uniref:Uncharacterized protein n=1 Tax=Sphaerosporella brunnea TaxID=1250544 RepID=A0A5J5F5D7_9PEZI|nr:hypothetical protein FN846DRAFT_1002250 [Sphaerosporella brunnea]